jgi:hypothetical protein
MNYELPEDLPVAGKRNTRQKGLHFPLLPLYTPGSYKKPATRLKLRIYHLQ